MEHLWSQDRIQKTCLTLCPIRVTRWSRVVGACPVEVVVRSNDRYINLLHIIFIQCIRLVQTLYTERYNQAIFSHIPHVEHLWSQDRIQKTCLTLCPIKVTRWSRVVGACPATTDCIVLWRCVNARTATTMVTYGQIYFARVTPKPHAPGRRPRAGDCHVTNHTFSRALCVKLSEVSSSIPIWVMGRAAAITSSLVSSGNLCKIHFYTALLRCCKR